MVCFDWVFPEVTRTLALKGADIICHPANLVLTYGQQTMRIRALTYGQQAMRIRALENGVFAVTANRYGTEKRPHGALTFTGQSQIIAPRGNVLSHAGSDADGLSVVEVDIMAARNKKMTNSNDLFVDRRPEFYSELSSQSRSIANPKGDQA